MTAVVRTTSDDEAFRGLVRELDADLWRRYGALQAEYAPHNTIEANPNVIVARDGATPIGCGCFKPFDATSVELKRMFVAPAARNRGVGAQIVDALAAWAAELGFARLVLETGNLQAEAIALYGKLGFLRIPPFGPYVDLPASICMARSISS